MVMLSDSPAHPEDLPAEADSLESFSSEGAPGEVTDSPPPAPVAQPLRPPAVRRVPFAIIDDRATREAIARLETYSETLEKLRALCASIDARLIEAEHAVPKIERMVATQALEGQSALDGLRSHVGERLAQTEEIVRRAEESIADRAVRELTAHIDSRVMGADEIVRQIEQLVASRSREELSALQALYTDIDKRLTRAEEVFQRPLVSEPPLAPGLVLPEWRVMKPFVAVLALIVISILFMMRSPMTGRQQVARLADREQQVRNGLVEVPAPSATIPAPTGFQPQARVQSPVSAVPPPQRTPAPPRRAVASPPEDEVAPRPFVGDLSIVSRPAGARVFINGRAVGVTPLVLYERQAGSVAVQIATDGFERWSASVQVRAGQMTNVAATLRPARP